MTNTTFVHQGYLPSKKEILERLLSAGYITFDEMWVLLDEEPTTKYVVLPEQPRPYTPPIDLTQPPWTPDGPQWVQGVPNPADVQFKPPTF